MTYSLIKSMFKRIRERRIVDELNRLGLDAYIKKYGTGHYQPFELQESRHEGGYSTLVFSPPQIASNEEIGICEGVRQYGKLAPPPVEMSQVYSANEEIEATRADIRRRVESFSDPEVRKELLENVMKNNKLLNYNNRSEG